MALLELFDMALMGFTGLGIQQFWRIMRLVMSIRDSIKRWHEQAVTATKKLSFHQLHL